RFRDRRIHLDPHMIQTADITIAHVFEQFLGLFCLTPDANTRPKAKIIWNFFKSLCGALFSPLEQPSTNAHVFITRMNPSPTRWMHRWLGNGPNFDIANHLSIWSEDKAN